MAAMLCLYLLGFSFAYRSLSAGTGALLLFGAVQLTMLVQGWRLGERLSLIGWVGFLLAVAGLVVLLLPGATAPDPLGAALMVAAGVGWGIYSLLGRGAERPLRVTAWNFLACMAPVLVVNLLTLSQWSVSLEGALLALASGALASGLGYVAWYTALPGLSAGRAATVQLSVPVMTALGGVVLLGEPLGSRLVWASFITLGGIALVLAQRYGD